MLRGIGAALDGMFNNMLLSEKDRLLEMAIYNIRLNGIESGLNQQEREARISELKSLIVGVAIANDISAISAANNLAAQNFTVDEAIDHIKLWKTIYRSKILSNCYYYHGKDGVKCAIAPSLPCSQCKDYRKR